MAVVRPFRPLRLLSDHFGCYGHCLCPTVASAIVRPPICPSISPCSVIVCRFFIVVVANFSATVIANRPPLPLIVSHHCDGYCPTPLIFSRHRQYLTAIVWPLVFGRRHFSALPAACRFGRWSSDRCSGAVVSVVVQPLLSTGRLSILAIVPLTSSLCDIFVIVMAFCFSRHRLRLCLLFLSRSSNHLFPHLPHRPIKPCLSVSFSRTRTLVHPY